VSDSAESTQHECPVCGELAVGYIEVGESQRTPPQIDDYWKICVTESGTYVHDNGVNDWDDYEF